MVRDLDLTRIGALHDLNLAAMFCDRIVALVVGRVAAYGTPETVLTADLLRAVFRVEADIVTMTTVGQAAYPFSGFAAEGSVTSASSFRLNI